MRYALVIVGCLVACGGAQPAPAPTPVPAPATDHRTLFERLGGQPAINAVVHEFVLTTKADARINVFFLNTDPVKLEQAMDDHVCSITGGGCSYKGRSMVDAHTGMKLGDVHFAAFMDDLTQVLTKLKVSGPRAR